MTEQPQEYTAPSSSTSSANPVITPVAFEPRSGAHRRRSPQRWLTFGALGLLLLLGTAAVYLFTGQSVLIEFDPRADNIEVDGALITFKLGDRWLLHSGEYTVGAEKAGYHPFENTITVTDAGEQEFLFSLDKLPGYLFVSTDPETTAEIRVDGQSLGAAPLQNHELPTGSYQLEIRAERYQPYAADIDIEGLGKTHEIVAQLEPGWSEVTLNSNPEGAQLWVADENLGTTPLTAEVLMGSRTLELRLPGYKTWTTELLVSDNQPRLLPSVNLEKADNLVRLSSRPSQASVSVNGDYRGQTPLELELPPGREYQFRFSKAGYQSARRSLLVEEASDARLSVNLTPILGQVLVNGSPADADVYIEGVRRGNLNQTYELPARPHRIEVRKPGYLSYSTSLTPNPDLAQRIDVKLTSEEAARQARTPSLVTAANGYAMQLIRPSGRIVLGSPRREQGRQANEVQRQVELRRAFYIGVREISNAQIKAYRTSHDSGVAGEQTLSLDEQPAVRISWDDAARFANWLSGMDGLPFAYQEKDGVMQAVQPMTTGYRLPTEAEWVLAARYEGDTNNRAAKRYPWGSALPPPSGAGNFAGSESTDLVQRVISNYRDGQPASAPVGQFNSNNLGLYDLGGNVREWIHDYYSVGGVSGVPVDPLGPKNGSAHVVRGSSWRSGAITDLRLAWRGQGSDGRDDIGFRLVRYAE